MELCTYLNYLRQAIRIHSIAMGKSNMDEEVNESFLKRLIIPDELTFKGVKCTFFYYNSDKNMPCINIPCKNAYEEPAIDDKRIFYYTDHFVIHLYKYFKDLDTYFFDVISSVFKTCYYPSMGGSPCDVFADLVTEYYKEIRQYLCENLIEQLDSDYFAALLSLKTKERF